jgi:hypothetical protein
MRRKQQIEIGLILILCLAILGIRYQVLLLFGFEFADSDEAIMWNGLTNYADGKFHEPRFYGQAYNTMLEALLAVPLYKLGIPHYKSLAIVTSLLTLFPYFLLASFTYKKKSPFAALLVLSVPLLMPNEYHLLSSLSRGFVSGIFIASFGMIALFYLDKKPAYFLLAFSSFLAYSISANSVLISLPCLFYVFLHNRKNLAFFTYTALGLSLGFAIQSLIDSFYSLHPYYELHSYQLHYSFELLWKGLNSLSDFLNQVSPIFWKHAYLWPILLLLIGNILLWKRNTKLGLTLLFIPFLLIGVLGISKVHDGSDSIFFSLGRMYLGLPILISIIAALLIKTRFNYLFFLIPLSLSLYNSTALKASIIENTKQDKNHVVTIAKIDYILNECEGINEVCSANQVDLLVVVDHYLYDFINYGCPACEEDFPKTLFPRYERRTWRLLEDEANVYESILFVDLSTQLDQKFSFIEPIAKNQNLYLCKNNKLPTIELLNKMNISVRKYK